MTRAFPSSTKTYSNKIFQFLDISVFGKGGMYDKGISLFNENMFEKVLFLDISVFGDGGIFT